MANLLRPSPTGYVIFCDDIRHEVSNKKTYVGVYNGEMTVFGSAPFVLAKLVLSITYLERPEHSREPLSVAVMLPGDDEPAFVADLPVDEVRSVPFSPDADEDSLRAYTLDVAFSPLILKAEGRIRALIRIGSDEMKLGSLRVKFQPSEEKTAD